MNSVGYNQYSLPRRSLGGVVMSWLGVVVSALLLLPAGSMVVADLSAFRPCSINSSGLTISSCGKKSVDISDLVLIGIFLATALLVFSAVTHALRMSRRTA